MSEKLRKVMDSVEKLSARFDSLCSRHDSDWSDWLAKELGTRKWVIARPSEKLKDKYDTFITQKQYNELAAEYKRQTGKSHF